MTNPNIVLASLAAVLYLFALPLNAQLELLQSLSPAQQQELLKQFKQQGDGVGSVQEISEPEPVEPLPRNEVAPKDNGTGLRPFGYELFAGQPSTFAPADNIPIPSDYILGPGDVIKLQLYGKENVSYDLQITRQGELFLPEIGSMSVVGLSYRELREMVTDTITKRKFGVSVNLTMGRLRSMRILVLGDARQPGSYTVSSLSTVTHALFVSGGIKPIGSLRKIQLKRQGKLVSTLDLYDLLLRGNTREDRRLQPGDVIFIPPVGKTVAIQGAVRRPAIYELDNEHTLEALVAMAGGLKPGAWAQRLTIKRYDRQGGKMLVDSAVDDGRALALQDGDQVTVHTAIDRADNFVELKGHVERDGRFAWQSGQRLSDVVGGVNALKPLPDLDFALILRVDSTRTRLSTHYVNPRLAFGQPGGEGDPLLRPSDTLYFFGAAQLQDDVVKVDENEQDAPSPSTTRPAARSGSRQPGVEGAMADGNVGDLAALGIDMDSVDASEQKRSSRADVVAEVIRQLKAQANENNPAPVVKISGAVRFPGEYPLNEDGTGIDDLIRAAGGYAQDAYLGEVELTRKLRAAQGQKGLDIEHRTLSLARDQPLPALALQAKDVVTVRFVPDATAQNEVEILGEVLFPGTYPIRKDENVVDLVQRAGGLTANAFAFGAVFTREDLKSKEQAQLEKLRQRLRSDIAAASLTQQVGDTDQAAALAAAQALLRELDDIESSGRLVIDLGKMLDRPATAEVLEDGDRLLIPSIPNEVTVVGEVQFPTSHLYQPRQGRNDYVAASGGVTELADEGRIYVVKSNGAVEIDRGWFSRTPAIDRGDTIIVPLDATPIEPLTLISSVTQIVYQLGLAAASFNAVGAF